MIKVKLIRLQSTHMNLRTPEIIGMTPALPAEGESFMLYAEPLDPSMDLRLVRTTPVVEISNSPGAMEFKTANSTYRLEYLKQQSEAV